MINDTLTELVQLVAEGIDFVTSIATETGKSIPVVHRQLDSLVNAQVLKKKRSGKRVIYVFDWQGLSQQISNVISYEDMPIQNNDVPKMAETFFQDEYIQNLFQKFLALASGAPQIVHAQKESLAFLFDEFLDAISLMNAKQKDIFLSKVNNFDLAQQFIEYCTNRRTFKEAHDPKNKLLEII